MNAVSRAYARLLLIRKAKRGTFDQRMCTLHGCSPKVNVSCQRFITRAYARKLIPTSTTGGQHSPTSYHPRGMAVDVGVVPALVGTRTHRNRLISLQRDEYAAWEKGERPRLLELIGPGNNRVVLNGKHAPLAEGSALENAHDNHLHWAGR